jgi:very-short-patch-repair endonuclease
MAGISRLDSHMWARCRSQDGVVSRRQLGDAGFSRHAIAHRVRNGRLWPCFDDGEAFAVGRPELSRRGLWRAALYTVGDDAAVSSWSAAADWELRQEGGGAVVHVSVPTQAGRRSRPGLVVHRAATLGPEDIEGRDGLRVTSLRRTLLDLCLVASPSELRALVREAEYRHRIDLADLRRSLDGHGRSPRHGRLRRVLDEWVPGIGLTETELEARFVDLCARRAIPLPEPQVRRSRHRLDFLWRDRLLVVEFDGYEAHRGLIAFHEDRARDRALQADGYVVLRFTWADVVRRPAPVADELRRVLARRDFELKSRNAGHSPRFATAHYDRAA